MKYLSSKDNLELADIVLLGIPFDGTSSFRAGSRFAPDSIRIFSDSIETYSPYLDFDIDNINFFDYGNLNVSINNFKKIYEETEKLYGSLLKNNKKVITIGGEHLVVLPAVKSYLKQYNDIVLIFVDAHTDLRDTYLDEKFSHATVLKRILEIMPGKNVYQFGVRSGLKEEFYFAKKNLKFFPFSLEIDEDLINRLKSKKVYLSIDLDVLDPSIFPGTANPEPGGVSFNKLIDFLVKLSELNIIGADVVELSPEYDKSGVSSIVAAKIIRELIIMLNKKN